MLISPAPGLTFDQPNVSSTPFWTLGFNVRFRLGRLETIGLYGPMRDVSNNAIQLPVTGGPYRRIFTTPNTEASQILAGAVDQVRLLRYDVASTPAQRTRYIVSDVSPSSIPAGDDVLPNPSQGRVQIPSVWWFADQDDVVVGSRANIALEPAYAWDRNPAGQFTALANSPVGAVGGGIINRVLVLLGCSSFTDPDPQRFMTIRWSDRFNFEDWTPSDLNISGELQLEGGSRIVGGGVTGFGVVAWTDKRMAVLVENFDIDSVFTRKYIDGGRGLLANNAWCEADGQVWWLDEARVLNVYDGGRPRQIPNPLKYGTIERLGDRQLARVYLKPNPEYGEVVIFYPDADEDNPDAQLVYNYVENAWSYWRLSRTCWDARVGSVPNVAVDPDGNVSFHDLDIGLPDLYTSIPNLPGALEPYTNLVQSTGQQIVAADVDPFDFAAYTNLVSTESVTEASWQMTRIHADHLPLPSQGAEADEFMVRLFGYGEAQVDAPLIEQDYQSFSQGQNAKDFRVGGKALRIGVEGEQIKTVFRFSGFSVSSDLGGQR